MEISSLHITEIKGILYSRNVRICLDRTYHSEPTPVRGKEVQLPVGTAMRIQLPETKIHTQLA